jgi:hypothetical protein
MADHHRACVFLEHLAVNIAVGVHPLLLGEGVDGGAEVLVTVIHTVAGEMLAACNHQAVCLHTADKGARIVVSTAFSESVLNSAVLNWASENLENGGEAVVGKSQLAQIESLTFTEFLEFDESQWATVFTSLNSVVFDVSNGSTYNAVYNVSSGKIAYSFVGAEDVS